MRGARTAVIGGGGEAGEGKLGYALWVDASVRKSGVVLELGGRGEGKLFLKHGHEVIVGELGEVVRVGEVPEGGNVGIRAVHGGVWDGRGEGTETPQSLRLIIPAFRELLNYYVAASCSGSAPASRFHAPRISATSASRGPSSHSHQAPSGSEFQTRPRRSPLSPHTDHQTYLRIIWHVSLSNAQHFDIPELPDKF